MGERIGDLTAVEVEGWMEGQEGGEIVTVERGRKIRRGRSKNDKEL